MPAETCFLGIDPGLAGGIAVIGSRLTKAERTPIVQGDKRSMNLTACAAWIRHAIDANGCGVFAVIEKVHAMPKQGISSSFNFGKGYGAWIGILSTLGIAYQEVTPQAWKKTMLNGSDKSDKASSINRALSLFPHIKLIPEGCRTPSDGIAEALLMAEYARRMYLGEKK